MPVVEKPSVRVPTFLDSRVDCNFIVNIPRIRTNRTTLLQFPYVKNVAKLLFPPPFKQTFTNEAFFSIRLGNPPRVKCLCVLLTFSSLLERGNCKQFKPVHRQVSKVQAFLGQESKEQNWVVSLSASKTLNWCCCWKRAVFVTSCADLECMWDFGAFDIASCFLTIQEFTSSAAAVGDQSSDVWSFGIIFPTEALVHGQPLGPVSECAVLFGYHGQCSCLQSSQCWADGVSVGKPQLCPSVCLKTIGKQGSLSSLHLKLKAESENSSSALSRSGC